MTNLRQDTDRIEPLQLCKICQVHSRLFFQSQILQKYPVKYYQCPNCGFVQTEEPYWLSEAYSEAIAPSDVGILYRNNMMANITAKLLFNYFDHNAKFLDYGGGYGIFVRLMRDQGFDFYWQDKYCQNLFARGFERREDDESELLLITAFELFEHLIYPLHELDTMLKLAPNIFFSTLLLPDNNPKPEQWWYYAPHEGQHIAIYTRKSLEILAEKYNLKLYTDGSSLHLLTTNKDLPENLFDLIKKGNVKPPLQESLLSRDFNQVVSSILNRRQTENLSSPPYISVRKSPLILIDGIFFQLYKTGIARVWSSLLSQWANTDFAGHLLFLDRVKSAPKISGIQYRTIPAFSYQNVEEDKQMLQQICDEEGADLFISSYYTTPITTPSVFIAYDMIPEVLSSDLNQPMWREKHRGIHHASAFIAISENTAKDLHKFFPEIPLDSIIVAYCGVDGLFSPATEIEIQDFKYKYGINKPYFLLTGLGGYKNAILFLQALQQLANKTSFDIVATGTGAYLPAGWRQFTAGCTFHSLQLSDEELRLAYAGAVALIYPSKYEGFGMPVIEAMACGCPVITTPNASLPEVAGEAALYVRDDDVAGMADALCEIQKPTLRQQLIAAGLEQAKQFSWSTMAEIVKETLLKTINPLPELSKINYVIFPDWQASEATLAEELGTVIQKLTRHLTEQPVTLLINTTGVGAEAAELFITDLVLGLTLETDFSVDDCLQIHYLNNLAPRQWQSLFPALLAHLQIQTEDTEAITNAQAEDLLSLSLSHPNYLICPNWQQDSEMIAQELIELFTELPKRTEEDTGTILVNTQGIAVELVTEMMLDIMAYLALEQNLDLSDRWRISLFQDLNLDQWQALSPWLQARLALPHENESIVTQLGNLNVV